MKSRRYDPLPTTNLELTLAANIFRLAPNLDISQLEFTTFRHEGYSIKFNEVNFIEYPAKKRRSLALG